MRTSFACAAFVGAQRGNCVHFLHRILRYIVRAFSEVHVLAKFRQPLFHVALCTHEHIVGVARVRIAWAASVVPQRATCVQHSLRRVFRYMRRVFGCTSMN